jgi:hypothetical protein
MKTTHFIKLFTTSLLLCVWSMAAYAGGYTNNFTDPIDFVASGVTGTIWDGVYLKSGDVVTPTTTGASIKQADTLTFPGFLTVAQTNGMWAGNNNDGFLLYKVVRGDFDASVEVAPIYNNVGFNFAGLLVRAVSDQSGQGFNPTGTNSVEAWMYLSRFNEFSIGDQVRNATNGADVQITVGGGVTTNGAPVGLTSTNQNTDTNTARFMRITRAGNLFSFYDKTNSGDAWTLEDTITRGDLAGAAMEVGISDATFSQAAPQVFYTDFELTGPNVNVATPAGDPSGLAISVADTNKLTLTWTPGAGSDGSVVILKPNGPLTSQPAYGITYTGNNVFTTPFTGSLSNLLSGGNNNVVYVGSGNTVTVSGLGSTNITYNAAVYSYKGSGPTISYDLNPAVASHVGPGTLVSVSFTVTPTTIPAGGRALATVSATYTSGDTQDVSSDPTTIWSSSNSNIVAAANGTLAGITNGSATVTATFGGVPGSQSVTVRAPGFLDTFNVAHDYVASNIIGSGWDGLYLGFGDIPGGNAGGNGPGFTTVANANISSNNMFTVTSAQTGFEGAEDDGFFLFKNIAGGDFQTTLHIVNYDKLPFQFFGLQARAAGTNGGPNAGGEYFFSWKRFDEFGISTSARRTRNGANGIVADDHDGETTDFWLLMVRSNFTSFYFYKKANLTDAWTPVNDPGLTGLGSANFTNMQVGIVQNTFVPYIVTNNAGQTNQTIVTNLRTAQIDYFMVDAPTMNAFTPPAAGPSGLTMTLNLNNTFTTHWTPASGSDGTLVVFRPVSQVNNNPVSGSTYTASSVFGSGTSLGSSVYVVSAGTNSTVTVGGLAGGTTYFAAAYSYSNTTNGPAYNTASPALASGTSANPLGVIVQVPGNRIPKGGIAVASLIGQFPGGTLNDVTSIATWTSANSNIVAISGNILTGVSNGTVSISGSALGFTNSVAVKVYSPTFTDNFTVAHDYMAAGVTGTTYDGVYTVPGGLPGTTFVSDPAATMYLANANMTTPGSLTVSNQNVGWEFDQNDGFYLFKIVPNDFQVAVHIGNFTNTIYNYPGLLARGFSAGGAPLDGTNGEVWVSWARFDEFGIGTRAELDIDNGITAQPNGNVGDTNMWLLMTRTGGVNFNFYQRMNPTDPWKPTPNATGFSVTNFAGLPMQVGIMHGGFDSGIPEGVTFDTFMLDVTPPIIQFSTSGGNLTLTWPAIFTSLKTSPTLGPSAVWTAVPNTWTTANGFNVLTIPESSPAAYYSLRP